MTTKGNDLEFEFADDFHAGFAVIHRCLRQKAVAGVEYMASPRAGTLEQLMDAHTKLRDGSEQHSGVEVSLHRGPIADIHPGLIDVDAPIDTHDISARGVQFAEESGGAGSEVDHWNAGGADTFDESARVRRDEPDIIIGAQGAYPAIEHLDDSRSGCDLKDGECAQNVHELAHEPSPQRFVAIHHLLGAKEGAGRAALDHVAGHGEGRADESDHGNASGERFDHELDRF